MGGGGGRQGGRKGEEGEGDAKMPLWYCDVQIRHSGILYEYPTVLFRHASSSRFATVMSKLGAVKDMLACGPMVPPFKHGVRSCINKLVVESVSSTLGTLALVLKWGVSCSASLSGMPCITKLLLSSGPSALLLPFRSCGFPFSHSLFMFHSADSALASVGSRVTQPALLEVSPSCSWTGVQCSVPDASLVPVSVPDASLVPVLVLARNRASFSCCRRRARSLQKSALLTFCPSTPTSAGCGSS